MFDKIEGVSLDSIWRLRMQLLGEAKKLFIFAEGLTKESNEFHNQGIELSKKSHYSDKPETIDDYIKQIKKEQVGLKASESTFEANQQSLRSEKSKLEANRLVVLSEEIWANAIREVYGNIKMEFKQWNEKKHSHSCVLYIKGKTTKTFNP